MMTYLNNAESTKDQPNENYGRELLELHSVGVDAGYSEEEMYNSALIMTGFGIDWDTYLFAYYPEWHYTGNVKVLGWSSSNTNENGYDLGLKYVRYLAHHPATARRIAEKLCVRFVSDKPPAPLVTLARQDLPEERHGDRPGAARAVRVEGVRRLIGQKVRRPREDIVASVRALGHGRGPVGRDRGHVRSLLDDQRSG